MQFTIPARQPFSLDSVLQSHGWIQLAPFRQHKSHSGFRFVDQLISGPVVEISVSAHAGGVLVDVDSTINLRQEQEITRNLTWMLGLDQDLSDFYALAADVPQLAHVAREAKGRIFRSPTFFEDIVKTILTTNTSWENTKRMANNLVEQFGAPLSTNPERRAFPHPPHLAPNSEGDLRNQARLGYRAPYVLEIAREVVAGKLATEKFISLDLPTRELRHELLRLKGIGPYAAANLLMLLGRYDYLPIDSWALQAVSNEWHDGQKITPQEVENAFAQWGQWKGLAYLFWDWAHLKQS